jgi:hypothetical protein
MRVKQVQQTKEAHMIKQAKRPSIERVGSADLLDPSPSFSDRALRIAVRHGVPRPTRFDDLMATALVALLGAVGLVIGWALLVS